MSLNLRIELILLVIIFLFIVIKNVNTYNLQLKYSLIWIIITFILAFMAFFPKIIIGFAFILGFEKPSNFIFLTCCIFLMISSFYLTIIVSKQSKYIKKIIQFISIENYYEKKNKNIKKNKENCNDKI